MNAMSPRTVLAQPGPARIWRGTGPGAPAGTTHRLTPSLLGELPGDVALTASGTGLLPALAALPRNTLMDVVLDRVAPGKPVGPNAPFVQPRAHSPLDPRQPAPQPFAAAEVTSEASATALGTWWGGHIAQWNGVGLAGVRLLGLDRVPVAHVPALVGALRRSAGKSLLFAWTPGMSWTALDAMSPGSVDLVASSLPWWDGEAEWFWQEHDKLRRIAPVVSPVGDAGRDLAIAVAMGDGLLLEAGISVPPAPEILPHVRRLPATGRIVGLLRTDSPDPRQATRATLDLVNAGARAATIAPELLIVPTGGMLGPFASDHGLLQPGVPIQLEPGETRRFSAERAASPPLTSRRAASEAAKQPRLSIDAVSPSVDAGLFPARRIVGEAVRVAADIVGDGHDQLAVVMRWRAPGATAWTETRMAAVGNDRYAGSFPLLGLGVHHYTVSAWRDAFATYQDELGKKFAAGVPITLELTEGVQLVQRAADEAVGVLQAELRALTSTLARADAQTQRVTLLAATTTALMQRADPRPLTATTGHYPVQAERSGARFASWYEVFPRSLSNDGARHGTFQDVERHLPRIAGMGFDVLYFPPIHPIGRTHRKGRNNTLTPAPDDPGSPYAIGSEAGGHDALHPELGTFEDFQSLRRTASEHGIELAIDFAIQCSPDHPWLKQHKDWFTWRPDGTIRYAENPPKKYEDIVNVDFYAAGAVPGLWDALCDTVLFWAEQGVRLFRVDNPHTKPMPFWAWMIAQVQARYPDAIFLAEAFTRPKVMYRLAKVGFSQSYTYFTWRDTKDEFTEYLTELTTEAPREFFRPHFFVNTPDINPVFLQTSGRPGFLIRAALAATLSGLWGVYNGFELCEGTPVAPGKEEYLDSEKYQIRAWDWDRPGNIVAEITELNRIRRENPALQSHLGVTFLDAVSDDVLYFEKATPDRSNVLIIAIALDPSRPVTSAIEFPFWRYDGAEATSFEVDDLIGGARSTWTGKAQSVALTLERPYAIWRLRLPE